MKKMLRFLGGDPRFCFIILLLIAPPDVDAGGIVANCDEASLRAAMVGGGIVTFGCDGSITLTNTLVIAEDTTLDATGHSITLSGGGKIRVLFVQSPMAVTLKNLTLADGLAQGADGGPGLDGAEAHGGAILVSAGTLNLVGCRIWTNSALGGAGGNSDPNGSGGPALGGAIYINGGILNATNSEFAGNVVRGGAGGTNNTPSGPSGSGGKSWGGSIYANQGVLNLADCVFVANRAIGGRAPEAPSTGRAGVPGAAVGGAVFNDGGTAILARCTFRLNCNTIPQPVGPLGGSGAVAQGGAVYNAAGSVSARDTEFTGNQANGGDARRHLGTAGAGQGGAFCNLGVLDVAGCFFQNNSAKGGNNGHPAGDGNGGAIFNGGQLHITQTEFAGNTVHAGEGYSGGMAAVVSGTAQGGAIFTTNVLRLSDSTFYGNAATGAVGGLAPFSPFPGSSAFGGGVYSSGASYLTNNTLTANVASGGPWLIIPAPPLYSSYSAGGDGYGGGLFQNSGTMFLLNDTFSSNSAQGGTGYPDGNSYGSEIANTNGLVTLVNTIVGNSPSGSNSFGALSDAGHNLSSDASCGFSAAGSLNNTDPKLGTLDNYGGPTLTMPLLAASPAIDGGDTSWFPPTDQRGRTRPYGSAPDIGAFESSPPYVIRGNISGFTFKGEVSVRVGSTNVFTTNQGHYSLEGLAAGTYSLNPDPASYLFVPLNRSVTVGPDQLGENFKAYQWNALSPDDSSNGIAHLVFAGTQGQTYRMLKSSDLVEWLPVATNSIGPSNYYEVFVPINGPQPHFFRTITP